jgi:hypothetical protein
MGGTVAEIKVQEKRGSRAWLWIIALIILAIILWYAFSRRNPAPATTTGSVTPSSVPTLVLATPARAVPATALGS